MRTKNHESADRYQCPDFCGAGRRHTLSGICKTASYPNHGLICEQNVDEMKRIFNKKFPTRLDALNRFLAAALLTLELVPVPTDEEATEGKIRDVKDRPILRAAIRAGADVLLTGDKDFLEAGLEKPIVLTPAEFLQI